MDGDRGFGSEDMVRGVVMRKERYLFYFLVGVCNDAEESNEGDDDEDGDNQDS